MEYGMEGGKGCFSKAVFQALSIKVVGSLIHLESMQIASRV